MAMYIHIQFNGGASSNTNMKRRPQKGEEQCPQVHIQNNRHDMLIMVATTSSRKQGRQHFVRKMTRDKIVVMKIKQNTPVKMHADTHQTTYKTSAKANKSDQLGKNRKFDSEHVNTTMGLGHAITRCF
ncbi:predicted protein [Histoplasma capsulatum G186AR]|uniref:Uncharacterized protein n=1 Tax=Ajellomyces capsulatus (strain G186AR / H82 / ATCC MYA-2454 / RMSCC 2432) TaxID=447093 RepID=C0NWF9_AJECG|nr:uncharacterized protein HCBG_07489 [Histoplasma capsulatum G186AR]EEH04264.1 predicted protein [Histoplasma capsulatum G186AR]